MNINFEKEAVEDLKRRKENFRAFARNLSPTEKIRQLELLQRRYYELLKAREENGGRKIPEKWRKWRDAQNI
ncbi:MAG: hypothetical protein H0X72_12815 [Acidobacteria bacterium]|jgi:hypothetical protein|nr:hypothetical protein [Acidobacteriota bacterium]HEV8160556.1 hypothetical protein [Pyrinomonadaceae bacterium]